MEPIVYCDGALRPHTITRRGQPGATHRRPRFHRLRQVIYYPTRAFIIYMVFIHMHTGILFLLRITD